MLSSYYVFHYRWYSTFRDNTLWQKSNVHTECTGVDLCLPYYINPKKKEYSVKRIFTISNIKMCHDIRLLCSFSKKNSIQFNLNNTGTGPVFRFNFNTGSLVKLAESRRWWYQRTFKEIIFIVILELSIPRPPIGITYGGRGIDHCMKREGGAMSIN